MVKRNQSLLFIVNVLLALEHFYHLCVIIYCFNDSLIHLIVIIFLSSRRENDNLYVKTLVYERRVASFCSSIKYDNNSPFSKGKVNTLLKNIVLFINVKCCKHIIFNFNLYEIPFFTKNHGLVQHVV